MNNMTLWMVFKKQIRSVDRGSWKTVHQNSNFVEDDFWGKIIVTYIV